MPGHGSHAGYRDMELFIATLTEPATHATNDPVLVAERLRDALDGRGPFRCFRDVLARHPELLQCWFAFSEEHDRGQARAWLAAASYRAAGGPPTSQPCGRRDGSETRQDPHVQRADWGVWS